MLKLRTRDVKKRKFTLTCYNIKHEYRHIWTDQSVAECQN